MGERLKLFKKELWTTKYRELVKAQTPELLRSKKRGKRSGTRQRAKETESNGKIRAALPSLFLSNVNKLYNKVDQLEAAFQSRQI